MRLLRLATAFALWLLAAAAAQADVFRPAYLELRQQAGDAWQVLWKVPAQDPATRLALRVVMPDGTEVLEPARSVFDGNALVERWRVRHAQGLIGREIHIEGRAAAATDVIVRVQRLDGSAQTERLSVSNPAFTVQAPAGALEVAWAYLVLGVEHILGGIDHLLFVLALLLVVRGGRRIVWTITAFTLAHSLTLVAATLGWVRVPGPPVEAVIALSIVFVAAEAVQALRGRIGLTARAPWVVAFSFGLLHGLGFAGALAEVGLPPIAIPLALLMFNLGVELGQLIFVAAVLLGMAAWPRLHGPALMPCPMRSARWRCSGCSSASRRSDAEEKADARPIRHPPRHDRRAAVGRDGVACGRLRLGCAERAGAAERRLPRIAACAQRRVAGAARRPAARSRSRL
jgi:hydrogenase/urease accessory protein HupE